MKHSAILFFIIFILSCNNKENFKTDFSKHHAFQTNKLPSNFFYDIVNLDSPYYKIKWGHKSLDTLITDTAFELLGDGPVSYLTANNSAILFTQGCGTNCNYILILPFSKKLKPIFFYEGIAIDTTNNLIAYVTEDDSSFFVIENFLNNAKIRMKENAICKSPIKFNCIDSCYFDGTSFYLKWFGNNYNGTKQPDWIVKEYSTKEIIK